MFSVCHVDTKVGFVWGFCLLPKSSSVKAFLCKPARCFQCRISAKCSLKFYMYLYVICLHYFTNCLPSKLVLRVSVPLGLQGRLVTNTVASSLLSPDFLGMGDSSPWGGKKITWCFTHWVATVCTLSNLPGFLISYQSLFLLPLYSFPFSCLFFSLTFRGRFASSYTV